MRDIVNTRDKSLCGQHFKSSLVTKNVRQGKSIRFEMKYICACVHVVASDS